MSKKVFKTDSLTHKRRLSYSPSPSSSNTLNDDLIGRQDLANLSAMPSLLQLNQTNTTNTTTTSTPSSSSSTTTTTTSSTSSNQSPKKQTNRSSTSKKSKKAAMSSSASQAMQQQSQQQQQQANTSFYSNMPLVNCAGCDRPILDQYLYNVLDRPWHQHCIQCIDCKLSLNEKCFSRDGKIFCKEDFFRRFGPKCSGCSQGILPTDLVRRAKDRVFHLNCFTCYVCRKAITTGEQLYVVDENKFVCKQDYILNKATGNLEREFSSIIFFY